MTSAMRSTDYTSRIGAVLDQDIGPLTEFKRVPCDEKTESEAILAHLQQHEDCVFTLGVYGKSGPKPKGIGKTGLRRDLTFVRLHSIHKCLLLGLGATAEQLVADLTVPTILVKPWAISSQLSRSNVFTIYLRQPERVQLALRLIGRIMFPEDSVYCIYLTEEQDSDQRLYEVKQAFSSQLAQYMVSLPSFPSSSCSSLRWIAMMDAYMTTFASLCRFVATSSANREILQSMKSHRSEIWRDK